jgi:hypothetical protein
VESDLDRIFVQTSPGSALDHDVLEAKIVAKDGKFWGKVDGEPKLWGPVKDATDADVGKLVLIGISQNENIWLISGTSGGGSGNGGGPTEPSSYSTTIGNGSATSFTVTHNLGSRNVQVVVYRTASPFDEVIAEVEHTSANVVTIRTLTVPATGEYTVYVSEGGGGGGAGGGDKNYVHNQTTPNAVWNVDHGLDKFPAIDVVESGGKWLLPDIAYVDTNTVQLTFGAPTSGKAYVN